MYQSTGRNNKSQAMFLDAINQAEQWNRAHPSSSETAMTFVSLHDNLATAYGTAFDKRSRSVCARSRCGNRLRLLLARTDET